MAHWDRWNWPMAVSPLSCWGVHLWLKVLLRLPQEWDSCLNLQKKVVEFWELWVHQIGLVLPLPPLTPFYCRGNPSSKWVSHFAKVSKELQSWVFSNPRLMLPAPSLMSLFQDYCGVDQQLLQPGSRKVNPMFSSLLPKPPKSEREREQGKYSEDQLLLLTHKDPFFGFDLWAFCPFAVQFCIPRDQRVTCELCTWPWVFGRGVGNV